MQRSAQKRRMYRLGIGVRALSSGCVGPRFTPLVLNPVGWDQLNGNGAPRRLYSVKKPVDDIFIRMEEFTYRHIGPRPADRDEMLRYIGYKARFLYFQRNLKAFRITIEDLMEDTVPAEIRLRRDLNLNEPLGPTDSEPHLYDQDILYKPLLSRRNSENLFSEFLLHLFSVAL
ncbi:unnamed protein product [Darwinula stevensoni]|uniref:Uncharacterized protein n=1 Tax=Darwinula stevensoni TaxID=69355 RepID=A0A7R9A585_9CRUS|nr:unnamed protein product [Darwinula stevensoni]CAG0884839.1 unnamed protein product [Darwinula stevensoni]